MYKIGIIDDEIYFLNKIRNTINKTLMNESIEYQIYFFHNAEEYLSSDISCDLLFLDIEMNEIDGITLSKQINNSYIIFVSSHDEYIRDAYGKNVLAYLYKDEIDRLLPKVLIKVISECNNVISLKSSDGIQFINKNNIIYFYTENRKIYVQLMNIKMQVYSTSLVQLQSNLGNSFYKVNDYCLVNLNHIHKISNSHIYVGLENIEIPIPRGKIKQIKRIVLDFKERNNHV